MANRTAILAIRIISDAKGAVRGFNESSTASQRWEKSTRGAARAGLAATAGLAAVGAAAFKQASDLQQSSGAVDAVFGKQAGTIKKYAKSAATSLGLARSEYQNLAATFGSQLKNMGVAEKDLVPQTDKLIKLGGDLAATYGGSTSEAVAALGSLMRGEADPIERYGVGIKQADVAARLAAKGQDKLTGAAAKTAKTEATLELLMEQTTAAQGQRAREAGSAAQAQEIALAKVKNAGAALGTVLLPVVASMAAGLASAAGWAEKNRTAVTVLAVVVGVLATAMIAVNLAFRAYILVQKAMIVGQIAFNAVMAVNPIVWVVLAVVALTAGLVLLYKRSERVRNIVRTVGQVGQAALGWVIDKGKALAGFLGGQLASRIRVAQAVLRVMGSVGRTAVQWVVDKARALWSRLETVRTKVGLVKDAAKIAFEAMLRPIQSVIDKVKDVVSWVGKIKFPSVPSAIKNLGSKLGMGSSSSATGPVSVAPTVANGSSLTALSRPSQTIVVQGVVDPDNLMRLLRRRGVRIGSRTTVVRAG